MAQLLEPGVSMEAAQKLAKEVVQRVGRGAVGDFAKALCNRVTCRLLPTDYMQAILERLISEGTDDNSGQALMALVADSANANPYIFAPLSHQASTGFLIISSCKSDSYECAMASRYCEAIYFEAHSNACKCQMLCRNAEQVRCLGIGQKHLAKLDWPCRWQNYWRKMKLILPR